MHPQVLLEEGRYKIKKFEKTEFCKSRLNEKRITEILT